MARWWLMLGIAALIGSGLPALELVGARAAGRSGDLFTLLFHKALVVHVDLSVLVWFLTMACMVWSREAARCRSAIIIPYLEQSAFFAMALGALLLSLSPLLGAGPALMSNYIPVIASPVFFLGLSLILTGLLLQLLHVLLKRQRYNGMVGLDFAVSYGGYTAALIALIALAAMGWAYMLLPEVIVGEQYYDMLFWAGGHVLQFTHVQMLMIAWLALAYAFLPGFSVSRRVLRMAFSFGLLGAAVTPLAFVLYDITSQAFRQFFTHGMIGLGGIGPGVVAVLLLAALWKGGAAREQRALKSALIMSMLVFGYGGVLGLLIRGQNVIIPAHYHGSIVGVTIAFMGLAYAWLPELGGAPVAHKRSAWLQPVVLGFGQMLHVTGLAILGGHGVLRKTPDGQAADAASAIAVQVMRLGGGLAIVGGVMFVVIVIRGWRQLRLREFPE